MEVRSCKKCKRLFNYIGGQPVCPSCREALETKFQEVKKYLFDNRGASVAQVVEACDVEENQVRQWIREERLEFASGIDSGVTCEVCGIPISTGKYCERCKSSMLSDLKTAGKGPEIPKTQPTKPEEHGNKMRYLRT